MKELLKDIEKFSIIPGKIEGASKSEMINLENDFFIIKPSLIENLYFDNDEVELYAVVNTGILYFKTIVKKVCEDCLELFYPKDYTLLQRREYSRLNLNQVAFIRDVRDNPIEILIEDISAGGMKIKTSVCLDLKIDYKFDFELGHDSILTCLYKPIRIEEIQGGNYIVSGRFKLFKSTDKIRLVQYCLNKQLEGKNK